MDMSPLVTLVAVQFATSLFGGFIGGFIVITAVIQRRFDLQGPALIGTWFWTIVFGLVSGAVLYGIAAYSLTNSDAWSWDISQLATITLAAVPNHVASAYAVGMFIHNELMRRNGMAVRQSYFLPPYVFATVILFGAVVYSMK